MKILVSACLIGENCKYNGGNNYHPEIAEYLKAHDVVSVCPEVMGGLPIPRIPSEIVNGKAVNKNNEDVDEFYRRGAEKALEMALKERVDFAILQSRSPSCGVKEIYDGTFSGTKIKGMGIFSDMLKKNGIEVIDSEDFIKAAEKDKL